MYNHAPADYVCPFCALVADMESEQMSGTIIFTSPRATPVTTSTVPGVKICPRPGARNSPDSSKRA